MNKTTSNSIKMVDGSKTTRTAKVSILDKCVLELSAFALVIMMHGAKVATYSEEFNYKDAYKFLAKLGVYTIDSKGDVEKYPNMAVTGQEIKLMIMWVQARIMHCEKERNEDRFNPETMVDMKLLLLDLRELMMPKELT